MARDKLILIIILVVAAVFRLYRNDKLQFWSDDEAVHQAVIQRMIINRRPTLVSPQPTLGTSVGSFFHIFSLPLWLITGSDPALVLTIFSLIGIFTTYIIYLLGKEVGDKRLGLLSAFFYASSFLASVYDRRWWPITYTPLLSGAAIYLAIRLVLKKKYRNLPLLALIAATSIHGDPAMIMVGLFSLILIILFKIVIPLKYWLISVLIVAVLASPLILFELRHPGAIVNPLLITISIKQNENELFKSTYASSFPLAFDTLSYLVFPKSSKYLEQYLYPGNVDISSVSSLLSGWLVMILMLFPAALLFCGRINQKEKQRLKIVLLFGAVFFAGLLMFGLVYKHEVQRVYLTLLFPIAFVLISKSVIKLYKKFPVASTVFVSIFIVVNVYALITSKFQYPLSVRSQAVSIIISKIGTSYFSLYAVNDPYLESGGITQLFVMANRIPKKSFAYGPHDWLFRSHSLYFTEPDSNDQERIAVIAPAEYQLLDSLQGNVLFEKNIDTVKVYILDNTSREFKENLL